MTNFVPLFWRGGTRRCDSRGHGKIKESTDGRPFQLTNCVEGVKTKIRQLDFKLTFH